MKLIVGLGNPGLEYHFSPHNLGFGVVDRLGERHSVRVVRKQARSLCGRFEFHQEEIWLIKPQTFMNLSGGAVKAWLAKLGCSPQELVVIADELDLPLGSIRIRRKGGAAGHHGLESIIAAIGSQQFTRLRIGVGPERQVADTVRYLLTPWKRSQRQRIEALLDRAADAVEVILREGTEKAMNCFNRRTAASPVPCRLAPEGQKT